MIVANFHVHILITEAGFYICDRQLTDVSVIIS